MVSTRLHLYYIEITSPSNEPVDATFLYSASVVRRIEIDKGLTTSLRVWLALRHAQISDC